MKDTTDRNRTSPFAFTGNKFEFRSLGSSVSIAGPNIMLNTAVAEALSEFYEKLKDVKKEEMDEAVHALVKDTIIKHKRIIFNGNGYTEEWVKEAEKRGLYNLRSTPDAMPALIAEKNVKMFIKHGIYSKTELDSRYEIRIENYTKTLHIEALTLKDMILKQFAPALISYVDDLTESVLKRKQLGIDKGCESQTELIGRLSGYYDEIIHLTDKLSEDTEKAEGMEADIEQAKFYHDTVLADMDEIRKIADTAEPLLPEGYLPYPTYEEMLFYV